VESVLEMIEMDAELLDAQDFETGQTGLHVAVQNQREDVIQLLLEKGADRAVLDNAGRNYYQLAVELGADEVQLQRLKGR
jgi:ankyrin repeat protein